MSSTEHPSQKIKSNQSLSGPPPDAAAAAAAAASSEYLEDSGTPTPSEKVSQWHRDIFMVGPGGGKVEGGSGGGGGGSGQVVHPRQCICDQCMAEYGTFKFYNQILQASEAVVNQKDMTFQSSMLGINYHSQRHTVQLFVVEFYT